MFLLLYFVGVLSLLQAYFGMELGFVKPKQKPAHFFA